MERGAVLSLRAWSHRRATSSLGLLSLANARQCQRCCFVEEAVRKNPPRPSAASFIKWPLVLKAARRPARLCVLSTSAGVSVTRRRAEPAPLPLRSLGHALTLCACRVRQGLRPRWEDALAYVRLASTGNWEKGRTHEYVCSFLLTIFSSMASHSVAFLRSVPPCPLRILCNSGAFGSRSKIRIMEVSTCVCAVIMVGCGLNIHGEKVEDNESEWEVKAEAGDRRRRDWKPELFWNINATLPYLFGTNIVTWVIRPPLDCFILSVVMGVWMRMSLKERHSLFVSVKSCSPRREATWIITPSSVLGFSAFDILLGLPLKDNLKLASVQNVLFEKIWWRGKKKPRQNNRHSPVTTSFTFFRLCTWCADQPLFLVN